MKNLPENLAIMLTPYGAYITFRDAETWGDYAIAAASLIPEAGIAAKFIRVGGRVYQVESKVAQTLVKDAEVAYKAGNVTEGNRLMNQAANQGNAVETTEIKESTLTNRTPSNPSYQAGSGVTKPNIVDSSASNAANAPKLNAQLVGEEIAGGHGFEKHVIKQGEFKDLGTTTREQYASHIEKVVNDYTSVKELSGGRTAYWDQATGTVVIRNPKAKDGGTAFRPVDGRKYFDDLR